jgi:hypothetical protein
MGEDPNEGIRRNQAIQKNNTTKTRNVSFSGETPVKKRKTEKSAKAFDRNNPDHRRAVEVELVDALRDRIKVSFDTNRLNISNAQELRNLLSQQGDILDSFVENAVKHIVYNPTNKNYINQFLSHTLDDPRNRDFLNAVVRIDSKKPQDNDDDIVHENQARITNFIFENQNVNDVITKQLSDLFAGALLLGKATLDNIQNPNN